MTNLGTRKSRADALKRTKQIIIRCSPGEYEILAEKAQIAGLSKTEYILQSTVYSERPFIVIDPELVVNLRRELAAQGNNLNQISRALNQALKAESAIRNERFEQAIERINKLSKEHTEHTNIAHEFAQLAAIWRTK